ncbi:MAG: hypothetical protein MJ177_02865 [Clostridia bacterium]|nr:hypothetical protein [Clostridia bacterium]
MSEYDFSAVLEYLCSGIKNQKEKQSVREELYDHLMCKYETGLAVGKSEEQAGDDAVNSLGDRAKLRMKLSAVHSYIPKISMKKAMNLLIAGIVLNTFHINLFSGMDETVDLFAAVLTLTGMFCLSKSGKEMKKAFAASAAYTLYSFAVYALVPFYGDSAAVTVLISCAGALLYLLYYFLTLAALEKLCAPYMTDNKKLRFSVCRVMTLIGTAAAAAYKLMISETGESGSFAVLFPVAVGIAAKIMTIILYVRLNGVLYKADHEYKIEDSAEKKAAFAVLALLCAALLTVGAGMFYSMQPVKTAPYAVDDTDMTAGEYENIQNILKSYAFDPDLLAVMPYSETENYRMTAPYDRESADTVCSISVSGAYREFCYAVPISERDDEYRVLRYVIYETPVKGFRTCFAPDNTQLLPLNDGKTTVLVLEKDPESEKLLTVSPYKVAFDEHGGVERVEYKGTSSTVLIIAQNFCLKNLNGERKISANDAVISMTVPFAAARRSLKRILQDKSAPFGYGYVVFSF